METYELFEESVRNRFFDDVTCLKENPSTIYVKELKQRFYLNEPETKKFQENFPFPTVVYDWDEEFKEKIYYMRLKSQGVSIREFNIDGDLIIMKSRYENGTTYSNISPIDPLDEKEMNALQMFDHFIEAEIRNRKKTRLPILFNMITLERWGPLKQISPLKF